MGFMESSIMEVADEDIYAKARYSTDACRAELKYGLTSKAWIQSVLLLS
jgi:hypothetical protein